MILIPIPKKTNTAKSITNGLRMPMRNLLREFPAGKPTAAESILHSANLIRLKPILPAAITTAQAMKAAAQRRLIRLKRGFIVIWKVSVRELKSNLLIRPDRVNTALPARQMRKMHY